MDKSPLNRTYQICSNQYLLQSEFENIQTFMSWNGFARNLTKKLTNAFMPHHDNNNTEHYGTTETATSDNLPKIWLRLPFIGEYCNTVTKRFKNKIRHLLKGSCKFILHWKITRSNCFLSCKDKTPNEYRSSIVYQFSCPGCQSSYIGKTESCLYTRLKEHSAHDSSEIYAHINSCKNFLHIKSLMELLPDSNDTNMAKTSFCTKSPLLYAEEKQVLTIYIYIYIYIVYHRGVIAYLCTYKAAH